eukprot:1161008-Pelagomonas_calceolata.AAC.4
MYTWICESREGGRGALESAISKAHSQLPVCRKVRRLNCYKGRFTAIQGYIQKIGRTGMYTPTTPAILKQAPSLATSVTDVVETRLAVRGKGLLGSRMAGTA